MKYRTSYIGAASFLVFLGHAFVAHAATITFKAPQMSVGTETPFAVEILLDAKVPINAVELSIDLPPSLEFVDASDGNSIISLWVERPHLDDMHQVSFAGLIPGGFQGAGGRLAVLHLRTAKTGNLTLTLDRASRVYTNTANGISDPIISRPITFTVMKGVANKDIDAEDITPPESFTPVIGHISEGADNATGTWQVVFTAQDKGSGVAGYQVAESDAYITLTDIAKLGLLVWQDAHSPHILDDQSLLSYVYVKVIDHKGNERIELVSPQNHRWYRGPIGYILMVIVALLAFYAIAHQHTRRKRSFIS